MRKRRSAHERQANADRQKSRRAERKALGVCINGGNHGRATHGVLCRECRIAHSGIKSIWRREPLWRLLKRFAKTITINTRRAG